MAPDEQGWWRQWQLPLLLLLPLMRKTQEWLGDAAAAVWLVRGSVDGVVRLSGAFKIKQNVSKQHEASERASERANRSAKETRAAQCFLGILPLKLGTIS